MIEERFSRGDSLLHRLDPRVKIMAVLVLTLVVALVQSFPAALAAFLAGIVLLASARLNPLMVIKKIFLVNTFIAFLWLTLPLTYGGEYLWEAGPLILSIQGVELAALVTIKANGLIMIFIALLATSKVAEIGHALRFLGLPEKFCLLLLASYRYIFVISGEYHRLHRAVKLRCFQPGTNLHTYRTYGNLFGMTLVRSWNRAGKVHRAMLLRGFQGRFLSSLPRDLGRADIIFLFSALSLAAAIVVINQLCQPVIR